jgi:hypothetical protein
METDLLRLARHLEEAFYLENDPRLQESLREMRSLAKTSGLVAEVSALSDPRILFHLARLEVQPSTAAALAILPMAAVAWADGQVEPAEREALVRALDQVFFFETIDRDVVDFWLRVPPSEGLLTAWEAYARELGSRVGAEGRMVLRQRILDQARQVAEAAGGFLGIGSICEAEQAVLARLGKAFE